MKIGIIGTGNIGGALTRLFRAAGYDVAVANSRGPGSLADLARETGACAGTVQEVAADNDVVVVSIPLHRIPDLPEGLFAEARTGLIVIDTCNYYPRQSNGKIEAIETGLLESEWVQQRLGHSVIKVFNTIMTKSLLEGGKPAGTSDRIALSIAGDDPKAKAAVMDLVDRIGFDTVDAGTIAESWRQQPGTPGQGADYGVAELQRALDTARRERLPQFYATPNSPGTFELPA